MCPLWPIHYILILCPLLLLSLKVVNVVAQSNLEKWNVTYEPSEIKELFVGDVQTIEVQFNYTELLDSNENESNYRILLEYIVEDTKIAEVNPKFITLNISELIELEESGIFPSFNLTGSFLGYTQVCLKKTQRTLSGEESVVYSENCCDVTVLREKSALDTAFVASVAGLVGIIYINMGAALDTKIVMSTIKKPIGPAIGFFAQFVIMPLLAYVIAKALITPPSLQLGLFVTGCSPGGGASNIWTLTLGGNLDLSITMTTISTFSAFVVFAIYTNLFLFELFTWEILVSGLLLPWLGYFLGGGTAWLLRQPLRDVIAIGIETGVQNTGLAILALRLSLPAPESDLTTVLPVAVAIMTPVLPLAILCFQKITGRYPDQGEGKQMSELVISSSSLSVDSNSENTGPEILQ